MKQPHELRFASHDDAYCWNCGGDWRGCAWPLNYPDRYGKRFVQCCEKCRAETVYRLDARLKSYT